jgi:hypothetical protein
MKDWRKKLALLALDSRIVPSWGVTYKKDAHVGNIGKL